METTKLSSKGQVIIPKTFRTSHSWEAGLELIVTEMAGGVLLRPKAPFEETTLAQVAGLLKVAGKARSQEEIDAAMKDAARSLWRDRG